jgi:hypothetical protein
MTLNSVLPRGPSTGWGEHRTVLLGPQRRRRRYDINQALVLKQSLVVDLPPTAT